MKFNWLFKSVLFSQIMLLTSLHAGSVSSIDIVTEVTHIPPVNAVGPWKRTVKVCGLKKVGGLEGDCFSISDINSDQGKFCYDFAKMALELRLPLEWTNFSVAEGENVRCGIRSRDSVAGVAWPQ